MVLDDRELQRARPRATKAGGMAAGDLVEMTNGRESDVGQMPGPSPSSRFRQAPMLGAGAADTN